ncbi:MAG: hypothetical protein RLZZ53_2905 [Acidobacteriota bacterium]|jgi:uncharacterized protein YhaN
MADMKATVTANVDCTALIQADLAALLFELVGDLRERCKRLEADAKPRERLEHEIDKLMRDRDEHQAVFKDMDTDREDLRQKLATVKGERDKLFTEVENLQNSVMAWQQSAGSWQEKHAEVTAERDELRAQLAELTKKVGELPAEMEPPEWHQWQPGTKLFHTRHPDVVRCLHDATAEDMERLYRDGWRELVEPEPAPEPYQWQVGDMIVRSGSLRSVLETCERSVRPEGWEEDEFVSQEFLEGYGWKLYRKASDLGVQQLTPRQVEISDSTQADGEGQS